jgi:hypothetical protein
MFEYLGCSKKICDNTIDACMDMDICILLSFVEAAILYEA